MLPRVEGNADIVEDFPKGVTIKEFLCLIKLLRDMGQGGEGVDSSCYSEQQWESHEM